MLRKLSNDSNFSKSHFDSFHQALISPRTNGNDKGHLIGDDQSTPDVNEAWEGGEAPVKPKKKTAVKKTTKKKTTKKASD